MRQAGLKLSGPEAGDARCVAFANALVCATGVGVPVAIRRHRVVTVSEQSANTAAWSTDPASCIRVSDPVLTDPGDVADQATDPGTICTGDIVPGIGIRHGREARTHLTDQTASVAGHRTVYTSGCKRLPDRSSGKVTDKTSRRDAGLRGDRSYCM